MFAYNCGIIISNNPFCANFGNIFRWKKDKKEMFQIMSAMVRSCLQVLVKAVYYFMRDLKAKDIKWKVTIHTLYIFVYEH